MSLGTISLQRPLTSYAKVQAAVGWVIRNRTFQLRRPRVRDSAYLDLGCGLNPHEDLINLDYLWHPRVDVCWDVTRGLPFADCSMRGVFSEHCLEHFPLAAARRLLSEIRRILAPGGTVRIVVPDAELYLRSYVRQIDGDSTAVFPYQGQEGINAPWSPMLSVNRVFYQDRESPFGHRTMFDFRFLALLLHDCGFVQPARCGFREGRDARLLIDTADRRVESLYVEASRPAAEPA
jgi:predicted SAM-dependent methyltransferase